MPDLSDAFGAPESAPRPKRPRETARDLSAAFGADEELPVTASEAERRGEARGRAVMAQRFQPAHATTDVAPPSEGVAEYLAGLVRNVPGDIHRNIEALASLAPERQLEQGGRNVARLLPLATQPKAAREYLEGVPGAVTHAVSPLIKRPVETTLGAVQRNPVTTLLSLLPALGMARGGLAGVTRRAAAGAGEAAELTPQMSRLEGALEQPFKVPRVKDLKPDEMVAQESFARAAEADPDAFVNEYRQRFGNVVDVDKVRELSPDYAASVETRAKYATATHETASAMAKRIYSELLHEPLAEGQSPTVLLMAGGTGAGKSTAVQQMLERFNPQVVYDASLSRYEPAKKLIDQALAAGKDVRIGYVYRDPVEAYVSKKGGVLTRAAKIGRTTPIPHHVLTHTEGPGTIARLASEYANNPRVQIRTFVNSEATGVNPVALETIAQRAQQVDPGRIHADIERIVRQRHAAGEISDLTFERATSLAGLGGPVRTRLQPGAPEPVVTPGTPALPRLEDAIRAPGAPGEGVAAQALTSFKPVREGQSLGPFVAGGKISNTSSIQASLEPGYVVEPGLQSVPLGEFYEGGKPDLAKALRPDELAKTKRLAEEIKASGRMDPVIVGIDARGAYIIEGGHRLDAAFMLDANRIPAVVVREAGIPLRSLPAGTGPARPPTARPPAATGPTAYAQAVVERVRQDPGFQERLQALGAGRVVTHEDQLARVAKLPPMTVQELAQWPIRKPVADTDVLRAGILRASVWDRYQKALFEEGDFQKAQAMEPTLTAVESGWESLKGVPGRALEVQKVLQHNNDLWKKMQDLRARNVPFAQVKKELDQLTARTRAELGLGKLHAGVGDLIRRVEHYATIAKLTSPVTHAVNSISNTMTFFQRGLEQSVGAGAALAQGDRALAGAMARRSFGTLQGFKDAWKKARGEFWSETSTTKFAETQVKPLLSAGVRKPFRALSPFRWLSAADAFWRSAIHDATIGSLAIERAAGEGLTGAAQAARVKALIENPDPAWKSQAEKAGAEYVFQEDPDKALRAMTTVINSVPGGRLIIPFVKTPYNILKFQVRRTPAGLLGKRTQLELAAGGRARAEAIGRVAVGTGITGAALATAWNSQVTGALPKDPNQRALWEAEGKKPWSIRVGNYWLSYNRFSPQGIYLAQVADVVQALKEGDEQRAERLYHAAIATTMAQLKDQPYMQGLGAVTDVMDDPERFGDRFVQGAVTGIIPNILRDVRQQVDPAVRKPANLGEAIDYMIPGRSQRLQARLDVFGRPLGLAGNRAARASKVLAPVREDEATAALEEAGWSPTPPRPRLTEKGRTIELGGAEASQYLTEMGNATLRAVLGVRHLPGWSEASTEAKADRLTREVSHARARVTEQWKRKHRDQLKAQGGAPR